MVIHVQGMEWRIVRNVWGRPAVELNGHVSALADTELTDAPNGVFQALKNEENGGWRKMGGNGGNWRENGGKWAKMGDS